MKKLRKVGDGIEPGPIEAGNWPDKLKAHVVTPGHNPRIHGYDVEGDLAVHYNPTSILLLTLLGELPTDEQVQLVRTALSFLAPVSVAEAPVHAGVVARVAGTVDESIVGIGAVCLAEQARNTLELQKELIRWLDDPEGDPPATARPTSVEDRASVDRLKRVLDEQGIALRALEKDLSRSAAILAILHHAGIKTEAHLETLFVLARLPCVVAESISLGRHPRKEYPIRLPDYRYEEEI